MGCSEKYRVVVSSFLAMKRDLVFVRYLLNWSREHLGSRNLDISFDIIVFSALAGLEVNRVLLWEISRSPSLVRLKRSVTLKYG